VDELGDTAERILQFFSRILAATYVKLR